MFERLWRVESHRSDEHIQQRDGDRQDDSSDQVHKDDKLHAEAEGTAKVSNEDEFHQVVDGRVDPSSSLGQENFELVRDDGSAPCLRAEHHLSVRESAE